MNTKTAKLTRKNSNLKGTSPGQKAKQISFRNTEDCKEVKFAPKALKLLLTVGDILPQRQRLLYWQPGLCGLHSGRSEACGSI